MKTILCICTYRRPDGLRRLLEKLADVDGIEGLEVVVSDNDAAEEGLEVCELLSSNGYPLPIHTVHASEAGISAARNAACMKALTLSPDYVAFLDDDEWPERQWLSELLRVMRHCEADVTGGPTRPVFPEGAPSSLISNAYYGADMGLPDGSSCLLQAGGNFLIRAEALRSLTPLFFHPAFAHSGGEDLAFFLQLKQRGYTMAWAANAIVHEPVPESRMQDGWIRQRVINIHNSRVRVMQLLQPGVRPGLVRGCKTVALATVALTSSCLAWLGPRQAARARELRWKFTGKMTAHLGRATVRNESY